jgi:two-component system, OmpR family, sensor histidine kinase CpxA
VEAFEKHRFSSAMNVRMPLSGKILLWLLLNLVFLAVVFSFFISARFPFVLDLLVTGQGGERVRAVADVIAGELDDKPQDSWDGIIERFSNAYHVEFALFRNDGTQLAGDEVLLPSEVMARVTERRGGGRRMMQGRGPPPGRGPRWERGQPVETRAPFMLRTSDPKRYWIGVVLPLHMQENAPAVPATLLAISDHLAAGGLLFDTGPWIALGLGVIALSVLFWWPLVRSMTRSISQMTVATEQIAAGRFQTRVAQKRRDELGRLGAAINQMAERIAGFVQGQRRFLGDIAHELCSPIARLQVGLGILEQKIGADQHACLDDVKEEVQQMSSLVNELLSFSKASLDPATSKLEQVALRPLIDEVLRREVHDDARLLSNVPENLHVQTEPRLLSRSLANILRNAVRYAAHAGPITISAEKQNDHVVISVADCGAGVPEEALTRIFEPFYRAEPSRDRMTGGVGLGLAIVRTCIASCGGTVTCRNRQPSGLEVRITLPAEKIEGDRESAGHS